MHKFLQQILFYDKNFNFLKQNTTHEWQILLQIYTQILMNFNYSCKLILSSLIDHRKLRLIPKSGYSHTTHSPPPPLRPYQSD